MKRKIIDDHVLLHILVQCTNMDRDICGVIASFFTEITLMVDGHQDIKTVGSITEKKQIDSLIQLNAFIDIVFIDPIPLGWIQGQSRCRLALPGGTFRFYVDIDGRVVIPKTSDKYIKTEIEDRPSFNYCTIKDNSIIHMRIFDFLDYSFHSFICGNVINELPSFRSGNYCKLCYSFTHIQRGSNYRHYTDVKEEDIFGKRLTNKEIFVCGDCRNKFGFKCIMSDMNGRSRQHEKGCKDYNIKILKSLPFVYGEPYCS